MASWRSGAGTTLPVSWPRNASGSSPSLSTEVETGTPAAASKLDRHQTVHAERSPTISLRESAFSVEPVSSAAVAQSTCPRKPQTFAEPPAPSPKNAVGSETSVPHEQIERRAPVVHACAGDALGRTTSTRARLQDNLPLALQHMLAGGAAGLAEHICLYPVDLVKTRMQSYHGQAGFASYTIISAVRAIWRDEGGLRALWRGVGAVALSAGPAHAVYFATYEALRARFVSLAAIRGSGSVPEVAWTTERRGGLSEPVAVAAAGALATVFSDGLMAPFDVVKQRMQIERHYRSVWDTLLRVYREQGGFRALYAGYSTALVMNVPFSATYFSVYEACREALSLLISSEDMTTRQQSPSNGFARHGVHFVSGAIAGAAAAGMTNPLDVVRTRLQTQGEAGARRYRNMWVAFRAVALEEGARGLWAGLVPRMLFHAPAGAIAWTTFELVKRAFGLDSTLDAFVD
ncbi:probable mitochondrial iron transporter Mrs3 [Cyanidioschyzon merolae strain 10D]|jgi:solute carrier family 25 iron transporter 28/37|uniref:Probable mitochondrial iron transporter Mrs3 n=1 Tax=Cyanidioschyzon merolae (strain NIES-3377 / 10D) TaxID=280699 RepID=M1V6U8_CYAM1|nr:probable mitochondrial iron transporter Mrs3 [Cyanidioschyzon merolae strain 10D]BAM82520.1 probable mitochondrial iron transporter Mrs3 [Cyanidioschyzon merolae strain 10D]|eukprot:XP_005538556.1 probable mitochondrial iron transporter Mrs3 [Cyanidioschyzon merolae strain 10D]